ncbi:CynX/NimT family MFS transporter [Bacillus cabrialesii]|uniref:CynX/NimT family MFS transporter n=1 Tax=Bacillus cabrialesii TaxID=2487276 RepID=UPI000CDAE953|nr:MFS transporter [Bacillus cabrialesii]AUZ28543.1 MFS transporter [Bacillus cereus]MDU0156083.1 MFS transporter [Bacillus cabrialesii]POO73654.1 MFS transporter [Bacillus subtilis]
MPKHKNIQSFWLITGIIFIAFNLRPAITSVGPVISSIRADLHMSNGTAGFLTALPLLSFAVLSPLAPKFGQRLGNERTLWLGLLMLLIGILLRSAGVTWALFAGTALIGIGIAIGNVLLPSLIKHKYPEKSGIMISLYTTSMCIFAALASGVSVPLAAQMGGGWKQAFLLWGVVALLALLIWIPQLRHRDTANKAVKLQTSSIWFSKMAWHVTIFMGLQSFLFYSSIAWFPEILRSHGMDTSTAGWMVSLMQFASLPFTFLTPVLADRMKHQRGIAAGLTAVYLIGLCGLLAGGSHILLAIWMIIIGIGQGSSISLALTLIGLRSENAQQAAALSGMSQSFGYLLAAIGPIFVGYLFDQTHSWTMPIVLLIAALILMGAAGLGAGRDQYILQTQKQRNSA